MTMPVASHTQGHTTTTTLPPPTVNSLDASQRARLVKSTRKLGNLLGATPHVLDPDLLIPTSPREKCRGHPNPYPSTSAASSVSSFEHFPEYHEKSVLIPTHPQLSQNATRKRHDKQKSVHQAPLVLRLRTVPSLPSTIGRSRTSSTSTLPSTSINPVEIPTLLPSLNTMSLSPVFAAEDDYGSPIKPSQGAIRRKRMAKLTRTLGENIPPEVVFPQNQPPRSPFEPSSLRSSWPCRQKDEDKLTTATSPNTRSSISSTTPPFRSHTTGHRIRRSEGASNSSPVGHGIVSGKSPDTLLQGRKSLPSDDLSFSATAARHQDRDRRESYWNGEWNIKDAEKRAMALRNLRS